MESGSRCCRDASGHPPPGLFLSSSFSFSSSPKSLIGRRRLGEHSRFYFLSILIYTCFSDVRVSGMRGRGDGNSGCREDSLQR